MQERFKHIFGLTRNDSEADISESESGIYLDELEGLNLNWLNTNDPFGLMDDARRSALKELETTLLASVFTKVKTTLPPFYGKIGQDKFRGLAEVPETGDIQLILKRKLFPENNSIKMKLKRIGLLLDTSGVVEVNIPSANVSVDVVCAANSPSYYIFSADEIVLIPFDGEELVISYDPGDALPLANTTGCGCGVMDANLSRYFDNVLNKSANGIILDVQIDCDQKSVLIANGEQRPAVLNVYAAAARYKAAELLIDRVLADDAISRMNMIDRDHLKGRKSTFRREYMDRINWLSDHDSDSISLALDPCFACRNDSGFQKVGILKTW
jgi:hypothetical protein